MASSVYEQIKASRPLPSPTGVALQILELARDDESSMQDIAAVVESDPATASRLLQVVNSSAYGVPRQIASVRRAVVLLGIKAVTGLALGFSLITGNRRGACPEFDYELFWSDSLGRAVAGGYLARRIEGLVPDEVFTCGLLSQIGRLALATAFPKDYAVVLREVGAGGREALAERERAAYGIDHNLLSAEMMRGWRIPDMFCQAVSFQERPGRIDEGADPAVRLLARLLHLSGSMAWVLTRTSIYRDTLSALVHEAAAMHFDPSVCHEVFDAISEKWREAGFIFSVRTRAVPALAVIYAQAMERRPTVQAGTDRAAACPDFA
jgi:HD-like signal output (HDOD) protein